MGVLKTLFYAPRKHCFIPKSQNQIPQFQFRKIENSKIRKFPKSQNSQSFKISKLKNFPKFKIPQSQNGTTASKKNDERRTTNEWTNERTWMQMPNAKCQNAKMQPNPQIPKSPKFQNSPNSQNCKIPKIPKISKFQNFKIPKFLHCSTPTLSLSHSLSLSPTVGSLVVPFGVALTVAR